MIREISKVINLIEDRIEEILESGDLTFVSESGETSMNRHLGAVEKYRFLAKLSKDLTSFDIGRY